MSKDIFFDKYNNKIKLSKDKLLIKEKDSKDKLDERYILLYSFINKYENSKDFPFFNKVIQLLYAYIPTWSMYESKIVLEYLEEIIKDSNKWNYYFLNNNYKFIDVFFDELENYQY